MNLNLELKLKSLSECVSETESQIAFLTEYGAECETESRIESQISL